MKISKKRPPNTPRKEFTRIINTIYDDINDIINSVNQSSDESVLTSSGKKGDIRIVKDRKTSTYKIQAFTEDGWAEVNLTLQ